MKTAAANESYRDLDGDLQPEPSAVTPTAGPTLQIVQADRREPLSKCVEDALRIYLRTTDGHEVSDLHRLVIAEVERPLFATVLRHVDGNLSHAAKILGLTRSTLRKRLADYGIDRGR
jgi:Fis family transcriptional regulator, factor for inversion stimulation protein